MRQISPTAAQLLDTQFYVREIDRAGRPHILLKVPELAKAADAELGIELVEEAGAVIFTVLLYDIPTEPVTYSMRLEPESAEDARYLRALIDAVVFHIHPCQLVDGDYEVGEPIGIRLPPNLHLRLKHLSLTWNLPPSAEPQEEQPVEKEVEEEHAAEADARTVKGVHGGHDARDTVIKKLKEQVQGLRLQVKEKEKRIIELEDELSALKSGNRQYKYPTEKKKWWKPF